ncbi:MAG TPA: penicillin-binding protein 2 [Methylomusa anaerophila]|uniref:Stage V sporulation protein D n=1 Tax=Methylomusa anaerophila TaxID=1930071 RepID=A0A348ALQ4_9FIRM|nr:penicillin-binding protein 2 [Methylomusa anaerophila]BBB92002.1 stage V sporulation protein D [Methylomusa anaerophila]HML87986.1 penicillin-binding protein 2 [Methylomusa anaerophila]
MTTNESNSRVDILAFIIILIFIILTSRLGFLQIIHGKDFALQADKNRIRLMTITAPRGAFYDRNGVLLVTNRPGFSVALVPISGPIADDVLVKLAGILGMNPDDIRKKIAQQDNPLEPIQIKNDVGPEIITMIEERRNELPGVVLNVQAVRNYINNELGAHFFGYVGEISDAELETMKAAGYKAGDLVGKSGLEKVYDKEIRGINGGSQIEVNVDGKPVQMLGKKEPVLGNSLVLTIDAKIQKAAEKAMDDRLLYLQTQFGNPNAKAAAAVVMNPQTGEILAMVSRPTFNPNLFNGGISAKDWKIINDNPFNPMQNRVINAAYPPGSAFKIVTGAAALEMGKVTPEEKILDTGRHWIIPKTNSHGVALGWIDFQTALAKSDNVYFYEMGNRLGIDNLEKYARAFGLGSPTGVNLPAEDEGLVANRKYKEKVYGEEWYLSETFDAAIGQGFQLATPLQMCSVISQIANGGHRYRPYLVSKIVSPEGVTVKTFGPEELSYLKLADKNLAAIRSGLRDVATSDGTAGYVFEGLPIPIAGKTSTAENPHGDDHGWFVAYAPYDNPTIAVAVVVEQGGYGSDSAAPIIRKILEAAFNLPPHKDAADLYVEQEAAKAAANTVQPKQAQ